MHLTVAPELTPSKACAKYSDDRADYDYDRGKLLDHVRRTTDGGLYSPYTIQAGRSRKSATSRSTPR